MGVLPILDDGSLGGPSDVIVHADPAGCRKAHVHSVCIAPSGKHAIAADLGLDGLYVYRLDQDRGRSSHHALQRVALAENSGPRHLAFHPSGNFVYLISELASTATSFAWSAGHGRLSELQTISTLPPGFSGENATAEIQIHPSGRFVYGSNRGHDSIVQFSIDPNSGQLTPAGHFGSGGRTPRHFAVSPCGRFLIAANQDSDSVVVFTIDHASGALMATGRKANVPCPVCVKFI